MLSYAKRLQLPFLRPPYFTPRNLKSGIPPLTYVGLV